nr:hypothetical protein [Tanacetum cinerariifolium]
SRRIESSKDKGLGEEDASKHGRIYDIDANEVVYLVNVHRDKDMFRVNDLDGDEVVVEDVDALAALKSMKPKADKVVIQDPEQGTRGTTTSAATLVTPASTRPKAKLLVIHEEMKKKDQISFDQQEAIRLQAELDEEERLAREKEEANATLIEEWNDIKAKIDTDYQLA